MNFGETIAKWAEQQESVLGLVLIGSRVRDASDAVWRADAQSDWDFQIIARDAALFETDAWLRDAGVKPLVYAVRRAAIGGVPKVALLADGVEADFVVLPGPRLQQVKEQVKTGAHRQSPELRAALQDLAIVIRPGWRFLKGAAEWEEFYRTVVADVPDPRLSDEQARELANGFVCDTVWALRKPERGELIAAQRMLHRGLAETNFRLLHELRLREGLRSFPEARRIERIDATDAGLVAVSAPLEPTALAAAIEKSGESCRKLMEELMKDAWRWPDLSRVDLSAARGDGGAR